MPVRFTRAIEKVKANNGRISITRGHLVYCGEDVDNDENALQYFIESVPDKKNVKIYKSDTGVLRGIHFITFPAKTITKEGVTKRELNMLPYYAWNNRGDGAMQVWFPVKQSLIENINHDKQKSEQFTKIKASNEAVSGNLWTLVDGKVPVSSNDASARKWTAFAKEGESHWLEMELNKLSNIESIAVYWADDNKEI